MRDRGSGRALASSARTEPDGKGLAGGPPRGLAALATAELPVARPADDHPLTRGRCRRCPGPPGSCRLRPGPAEGVLLGQAGAGWAGSARHRPRKYQVDALKVLQLVGEPSPAESAAST